MAKLTKAKILALGAIEAMMLCNKHGLPEGSKEEMIKAILKHFEFED